MGSSQSLISSEAAISLMVVAGAIGLGYMQLAPGSDASKKLKGAVESAGKKGKKKSKKSPTSSSLESPAPAPPTPVVVPFPTVIPGGFDSTATADTDASPEPSKRSKAKKKKAKLASSTLSTQTDTAAPKATSGTEAPGDKPTKTKQAKRQDTPAQSSSTSSPEVRPQKVQSSASIDTDSSWTRVDRRTRAVPSVDATTTSASEADAPTPVTGGSSPVAERTDDDDQLYHSRSVSEPRRPLAERLLPKARKTGVDDMLETPDHPTLARVMRVKPLPEEKPASGFSWGDYEDVRNDADVDGEDDDAGWGVVKSRRSRPERTGGSPSSSQTQSLANKAPETLTKRQRQNAAKRDAQKADKVQAEEERLAQLAKHKRSLEKERMEQQQRETGGKKVSGGMTAKVDERGKLVWE